MVELSFVYEIMEVWLSIIIGAIITGTCTGIAIYATGRQIGFYIERVIKTIHDDIKHSQEKLERKIQK